MVKTGIQRIFSGQLMSLNAIHKEVYYFCMNCLSGFCIPPARDKHYECCSINGHAKVKVPSEEVKSLVFYDGQYHFKVLLMLDADFESILKPVDEKYIEKINQMRLSKKVRHHVQKRSTHTYRLNYGFRTLLLMEIFLVNENGLL